jgi:hypothetical protein
MPVILKGDRLHLRGAEGNTEGSLQVERTR